MWNLGMLFVVWQIFGLIDVIIGGTVKREINEAEPVDNQHCNSPLGIAQDSINIQVGFTITSNGHIQHQQQDLQQHGQLQQRSDHHQLHDLQLPLKRQIQQLQEQHLQQQLQQHVQEQQQQQQQQQQQEHHQEQQQQQQESQAQPEDQPLHSENDSAWRTETVPDNSYIQVEFERVMLVSGIVTQGSSNMENRVTHFRALYSTDCIHYLPVTDKLRNHREYVGDLYINATNTVRFDFPVHAKCIRVLPTQRIGEETTIRFELLGCDISECDTELVPMHIQEQFHWKKFEFDTEKIISSVRLSVNSSESPGVPAFILAASRNCEFDSNDRFEHNGQTKIFTVDPSTDEIVISDELPIRALCFAVFSPDPRMISLPDVHISELVDQLLQMDPSQYHVTFQGCDALEPRAALDSCGKTRELPRHDRKKRVVGGDTSLPGEWPWLVSLHFLGPHEYTTNSGLPHLCGASLIHPEWVLSAAHCFDNLAGDGLSEKDNWVAVVGEHHQGVMDGTEQFISIERIIKHPDFFLAYNEVILNDIALLKLSRPVVMTEYINTICLEPNYTVPDGSPCLTTGWGFVEVDGVGVELPNSAELLIVPRSVCAEDYDRLPDDDMAKEYVSIQESVVCARAERPGVDSCKGDSGGPLICYHDDHWVQTGIVSIGYACGDIRYPGIYTNVNYFYDWIDSTIADYFEYDQ